jgi:anti-sigma factor (TIGR02949 family)
MNRPEMIPCDQVIARLWQYVDGELNEESSARIRDHLEICSRCFPQYDFQRAYKEFALRSGRRPVPPLLRRRVFEAILQEEMAVRLGTERVGLRLQRWLRRVLGRKL